jgi:hypothetical protein
MATVRENLEGYLGRAGFGLMEWTKIGKARLKALTLSSL